MVAKLKTVSKPSRTFSSLSDISFNQPAHGNSDKIDKLTHPVTQVRLVMQEHRYSRLRVQVSALASPSPHVCQGLLTALEAAIHSLTVSLYPHLVSEARVRCPCLASKVTIITMMVIAMSSSLSRLAPATRSRAALTQTVCTCCPCTSAWPAPLSGVDTSR